MFINACVKCVNILQMKRISWLVVKLTLMNNLICSPDLQGFTLHLNTYQTKKNAVFNVLVKKIKLWYWSRNLFVLPNVRGSEWVQLKLLRFLYGCNKFYPCLWFTSFYNNASFWWWFYPYRIESAKTTSMEDVSTGVLEKNIEVKIKPKIICIKKYMIAYVKIQNKWRYTIHYVKPKAQLLYKNRFRKGEPTCRR